MNPFIRRSTNPAGRTRRVPWLLIWTVALSLFVAAGLSAEFTWRRLGYRPSAVDSPALWKFWYERAVSSSPKTIALIGASRIQAGISTGRMRERLPDYQIVQLGQYAGDSPVGVLRALAGDQRFNGIVICDMLDPFLIRERWESQRDVYESSATRREQLEAFTRARAADLLAINNSESGIVAVVKKLTSGARRPSPSHIRMRADRSIEIDFALMEHLQDSRDRNAASFQTAYKNAEHASPENFDDEFRDVTKFVRRIQDRGGQVVFVRLPSSGERLKIEEQYHPKAKYWDRFSSTTSGVCIHWTELEDGDSLSCPDDSHLDCRDAARFTDLLVDEAIERGIFKVP